MTAPPAEQASGMRCGTCDYQSAAATPEERSADLWAHIAAHPPRVIDPSAKSYATDALDEEPVEHIDGRSEPRGPREPRHLHPVTFKGSSVGGSLTATCAECPGYAGGASGVYEAGPLLLRVTLPHSGLEDSPQYAVIKRALRELADLRTGVSEPPEYDPSEELADEARADIDRAERDEATP